MQTLDHGTKLKLEFDRHFFNVSGETLNGLFDTFGSQLARGFSFFDSLGLFGFSITEVYSLGSERKRKYTENDRKSVAADGHALQRRGGCPTFRQIQREFNSNKRDFT